MDENIIQFLTLSALTAIFMLSSPFIIIAIDDFIQKRKAKNKLNKK